LEGFSRVTYARHFRTKKVVYNQRVGFSAELLNLAKTAAVLGLLWRKPDQIRNGPLQKTHSVSRKKVPKARGPSPTGIFAVTASVSVLIAQYQLTT
jgi:hypothetical protein